ncbi:MAG: acyl-CoA dehydrogenase [Actinomycetia bacterium]|nr:acyl-CoA dehydrogenase [Actinomycetes bacterium]
MNLKLSYDDEQLALQDSIDGFCRRAGTGPLFATDAPLPATFWSGLASLGVLLLGTEAGGGGALEIAAAMETLGRHGAPGPLVGTFAATALLADDEIERIGSGDALVSVGQNRLFPWAPVAGLFVEVDGDEAWLIEPGGAVDAHHTTGNEPWGYLDPVRVRSLGDARAAMARTQVAAAAYLVGAAQELIDLAAEYARDRVQFNKPIATFQAVSHPLAVASVRLNASRILTRGAAQRLDSDESGAHVAAAVARLSAIGSAMAAGYQAHQLFGAMGFTLEGPVGHLSHRIRQVGLLPPNQNYSHELVLDDLLGPPLLERTAS